MRRGFTLLEVMMALLLFLGILVAATRLAWVDARVRTVVAASERRQAAASEVLSAWKDNPDRAAIARVDPLKGWEVILLPDTSWVPMPAFSGSLAPAGGASLWRRHEAVGNSGQPAWDIEWYDAGVDRWRWWLRVRANPRTGAGVP